MNKIKMIVVVAIVAVTASCGTPTKKESAKYELDTFMVNYHKWHGLFVTTDTIPILNRYGIIVGEQLLRRWTKADNIVELHADDGISCDTIWYSVIKIHDVKPIYQCDAER